MASPLENCTVEEQRAVIRFLVADFHLFGPLKEGLQGKHFQSNKEVKNQVQKWLRDQPKEFYAKGIYKLAFMPKAFTN